MIGRSSAYDPSASRGVNPTPGVNLANAAVIERVVSRGEHSFLAATPARGPRRPRDSNVTRLTNPTVY